jgi:hypothetical protein
MDWLVEAAHMDVLRCGDPYQMMQETKRSVRMDISPVPGGDVDKNLAAAQAAFAKYHEGLARGIISAVTKPVPGATISAAEPKFMCRKFLVGTLVELGDIPATEALAKMTKFLCEESAAQITKDGAQTRASKHAHVSVPVGDSRLQCTVRFKVYRTDCQSGGSSCLVLEITRRSGDAVAFGHISIRAKDYLLQRPMSEIPAPPPLEALLAKSGGHNPQDEMPGLFGMLDEEAVAVLATPMK